MAILEINLIVGLKNTHMSLFIIAKKVTDWPGYGLYFRSYEFDHIEYIKAQASL